MKNLFLCLMILIHLTGYTAKIEPVIVNFKGKISEKKWSVKTLNPKLPAERISF